MKIKQSVLDLIDTPKVRTLIAVELGCGEQAVAVQLRENKPFGRLTNQDALFAISKVSGIDRSEILEETEETATIHSAQVRP